MANWNSVTIQITDAELEQLAEIQERRDESRHALLREALERYLRWHQHDAAAAESLERLGQYA